MTTKAQTVRHLRNSGSKRQSEGGDSETRNTLDVTSYRSEIREGMRIDWDVPVTMNDGLILRCDLFRPIAAGRYPVIMSYGPYGKLVHFSEGYPAQWSWIIDGHPDVLAGSSNKFQCFEVVDPEKFVPDGYVVVRFDSRGAGRSPGHPQP